MVHKYRCEHNQLYPHDTLKWKRYEKYRYEKTWVPLLSAYPAVGLSHCLSQG